MQLQKLHLDVIGKGCGSTAAGSTPYVPRKKAIYLRENTNHQIDEVLYKLDL